MSVSRAGRAGRPQTAVNTGPGYKLAEWLNQNWSERTDLTNFEAAQIFNFKSPAQISMWRTGKSRVAIEWLAPLSRLLKVDLAFLMRLWVEQDVGPDAEAMQEVTRIFERLASEDEARLLEAIRHARTDNGEPLSDADIEAVARLVRT